MKLFTKKQQYITVVADEVTNFDVQRFAENHSVKNSIIDIRKLDEFIAIGFNTKIGEKAIFEKLEKEFRNNYSIKKWEDLIVIAER